MTDLPTEYKSATETPSKAMSRFDGVLAGMQIAATVWLLFAGTWSGPEWGASLAYPNGFMAVEALLLLVLLVQARRGLVQSPLRYPFFRPLMAVLLLLIASAVLRILLRGVEPGGELLSCWRLAEPMARSLLLFLAIAGQVPLLRTAWYALFAGMLVNAGAAIAQHVAYVERWYVNLDAGWTGVWQPTVTSALPARESLRTQLRVQGLASYANLAAACYSASLPCWVIPFIYQAPRHFGRRLLLLIGGIAVAAALWYTNSRGPMVALAIALLMLLFNISWRWRFGLLGAMGAFILTVLPASRWWALLLLLTSTISLTVVVRRRRLLLLLPILFTFSLAGGIEVFDAFVLHYRLAWRLGETGFEDHARVALYRDGLRTVSEAPCWGIGDAAVAARVLRLPHPSLRRLPATQQNYHNQYLQWAGANGLPVALAFTLLLAWVVAWCWRRGRTSPLPYARILSLSAAVGMATFLLANFTDAHFWRIEGGGFFWSLAAVIAAGVKMDEQQG